MLMRPTPGFIRVSGEGWQSAPNFYKYGTTVNIVDGGLTPYGRIKFRFGNFRISDILFRWF